MDYDSQRNETRDNIIVQSSLVKLCVTKYAIKRLTKYAGTSWRIFRQQETSKIFRQHLKSWHPIMSTVSVYFSLGKDKLKMRPPFTCALCHCETYVLALVIY